MNLTRSEKHYLLEALKVYYKFMKAKPTEDDINRQVAMENVNRKIRDCPIQEETQ